MKRFCLFSAVILAVVALLFSSSSVVGAPVRTPFTMKQCNTVETSPGTGEIIGDKLVIRDIHNISDMTSSDPRLTGTNYSTFNAVLDLATITGPVNGVFHIVNDGGGWIGRSSGYLGVDALTGQGRGNGYGEYEGLVVKVRMWNIGYQDCVSFEGVIVEAEPGE